MGGNAGESYHAVSLSGGKDSTAMLLLMIERDMPVDVVLTADTGMEFPEMYEHLQKLDDLLCRERGIHITTLRHPKGFEWLMFEEPKVKQSSIENRQKLGVPLYGNGWPGPRVRWCTGTLKTHLIHKEVNRLKKSGTPCTMSGLPPTSRSASKTTNIPWWSGELPKQKLCGYAMTEALIGAACIRFTTAVPVGAAPSTDRRAEKTARPSS
ncbi:MAG: phosphoadenosine phosphosulfate reductase family protein [Flavonifractor plautii]